MSDPSKKERANVETVRKPYRSSAATYEEFKKEIPDDDYFGLKHSEFKKPWLTDYQGGYDEMEYRWDFPLPFIDPINIDIEVPDGGSVYPFPGGIPWNPNWNQPGFNPNYPFPKPRPNTDVATKPGGKRREKIIWDCVAPWGFEFCPGETVTLLFEEGCNNRIQDAESYGDDSSSEYVPGNDPETAKAGRGTCKPGYATGTKEVIVEIPADYVGDSYTVTAYSRNGEECSVTGTKRSYCDEGDACAGVSIGYTSQSMETGESQGLSIVNGKDGVNYEWVYSGGGTLVETGGGNVTYTAPASNPNCLDNPTIQLRQKGTGVVCATLKIAVGAASPPSGTAYFVRSVGVCGWTEYVGAWCDQLYTFYNCSGQVTSTNGQRHHSSTCDVPPCHYSYSEGYDCAGAPCEGDDHPAGTFDSRTAEMKEAGCCPSALL